MVVFFVCKEMKKHYGRTNAELKNSCKGAALMEGRRFSANADKTEIVDTGDDSHMILWISIMLASMMMVIGVAVTRKRMK